MNILKYSLKERALQALRFKVDNEEICKALVETKSLDTIENFTKPRSENDFVMKKYYARALFEKQQYTSAIPVLESLYEHNPEDSDIGWWYGRALELTEETEQRNILLYRVKGASVWESS